MKVFSNDIDLLRYEPALFAGSSFAGQTLCRGVNGQLSGTTLTAAGENFVSEQVAPGHVVYLSDGVGNIDGAFEIVSVDSATQLTVSVLRADRDGNPVAVGVGANLFYRIGTFDAIAGRVFFSLTAMLGMQPGLANSPYTLDDLLDAEVLREVSTLMCLERIYTGLYRVEETDGIYLEKRTHFRRLAEKTKTQTIVRFDLDNDDIYERSLCGGYASLIRE